MPADIDRDLEEGLLRDGAVDAALLAKAKERAQKAQGTLEDALLDSGACTERDVLRALARTYHLQYLMSEKAAQLKIPDDVLERVPVRTAEALRILPFRLDETNALWLLTASPLSEEVVAGLLKSTGARAVNRLLVRRNVLWAATRCFYYRDLDAFAHPVPPPAPPSDRPEREDPFDQSDVVRLSETLRCPGCGAPASLEMFQCRECGLLLNAEASAVHRGLMENSIVRALLAPPDSRPRPQGGYASADEKTRRVGTVINPAVVPVLVAGLDVFERPLHEFEAFVATFVDGEMNVPAIAEAANLPEIEVQAVLRTLAERKLIELTQRSPPPPVEPVREREPVRPAAPSRAAPPPPAKKPQSGHDYVLQQAVSLERRGRIEDAIAVLEGGIAKLPRPAPLYNRLALVLLDQRRDYGRAEALLRKAVELEPSNDVYSKNLYKVLGLEAVSALAIEDRKKK